MRRGAGAGDGAGLTGLRTTRLEESELAADEPSLLEGVRVLGRARSSRLELKYSRSSLPKGEDECEGVECDGGKMDIKSWPLRPPGRELAC